ncbi:MAG TPA: maleylpyruvate isomerase family mycothiol-dependent enzyme [Acidimicrobiales bacterium]
MERPALLFAAEADARALLVAAETDWGRPVPHCPEWDAAGLVRHTGGIFMWMAAVVTSGERVSRRTLAAAPDDPADLAAWYVGVLDRTLAALAAAQADAPVWTFSATGNRRVAWWCRRLAVEVAIHRWDAQHAVAEDGAGPGPLDGEVAAAGIEEFVVEFLPGLLAREGVEGLGGTLHLHGSDGPAEWWIDLDTQGSVLPDYPEADTTVRGTRSDLLLWLTNRGPLETIEVSGTPLVPDGWHQLRR